MSNQFRADLWDAIGAEDEQDPTTPQQFTNVRDFQGLPADQVPPGMSDLWERLGAEDPEPGELADPSASRMDYRPEPLVDWDGRKVPVRKIIETAKKFDTTPEAIYRMGTGVGKFEAALNQNILGQGLRAVESGVSISAEAMVSQIGRSGLAKMFGIDGDQLSRNIHEDRRQRQAFNKLINADTDMAAVLGPKGSEIYNDATEALAQMGSAAYLGRMTGPAGSTTGALTMYSALGVSAWDSALEEARVQGKSGNDQVKYATAMTGVELGITAVFGRIAKYVGGGSAEEMMTPGVIHAARTASGRVKQAAIGMMSEVDEEALVNATQQGVQMLFGMRDKFDPAEMVQAGVTGAVAGGMGHGISRLMDSNNPYTQDLVKGALAAETAVENAYKPPAETQRTLFPMDDPRQQMLFPDAPAESETGLGPLPDVEIGTQQMSLPPTQQGLFDPVATTPAEAVPQELSRRDQMAAAMARTQQSGPAGRGARDAKSFAERATPEVLEKLRKPVNAKEFASLTGIKKTSAAFRESFRDVLDLYLRSPREVAADATGAQEGVGQPGEGGAIQEAPQEPTQALTREGVQRSLFDPQQELFDKSVSQDLPFQQVAPAEVPAEIPRLTQRGLFNPQQELFANTESEYIGTPQPGGVDDATPPSPPPEQGGSTPIQGEASATDTPQTGDAGSLSMPDPAKVANLRLDWLSTKQKLGEWYRRNLEMKRGLNRATFDANEERIGNLAADVRDTELLIKDLRRAGRDEYEGTLPREAIDKRLKGEYTPLLPKTAAAVSKMRAHIDHLSKEFRELGILDPDSQLYLTIEEGEGTYMYRAYARNEDINWASKVKRMPDVLREARAELAQMYPQDSAAKTEWRINQIIDPAHAEPSPDGEVSSGEFLGNLQARKDIPEAIRNLMGEYKDGVENFLHTSARLSMLVHQAKFSRDVISDGLKNGYLIAEPDNQPGLADKWARIDGHKVPALKLFHGLYTTPEFKARLEETFSGKQSHEVYRMAVAASGWSKFAQTALNPSTYMANYLGGYFFQMTSGDLFTKGHGARLGAAHLAAAQDVMGRGDDAARAYLRNMYRLGLIGNEVGYKDIQTQLEASSTFSEFMETGKVSPKAVIRFYGKNYQAQDTVHKIAAFESKKVQYARAYPNAKLEEIEKLAAEDVKQHQPTWSRVNRASAAISRAPFIADYFSFLSESARVTKNAIVNAYKEVQSDNPEIRKIGQRRLLGLAVASVPLQAASMISQSLLGITDEEDEALRKFLAPWYRDSSLFYISKDGSKYQTMDLSRLDPRGTFWKAFRATALSGDPVSERAERAVQHVLGMEEAMLSSRLLDWRSNKRSDGFGRVYDPQAPLEVQTKQVIGYLGRPLTPGGAHMLERMRKGAMGEVGKSGQPHDLGVEAMAMFGFRAAPVDTEFALEMSFTQSAFALGESEAAVRKAFTSRGTMRPGELIETYDWVHQARKAEVAHAHDMLLSSAKVGVSPASANAKLVETFRGKSDMIWTGQVSPYFPSDATLEEIASRTGGNERIRLLLRLYKEKQAEIAEETY